jgi:hypothetical protein
VLGKVGRIAPFRADAVLAERLELLADVVTLLLVRGQAQAAVAPERVVCELGEPVERLLGPLPEEGRHPRPV